MVDEHDDYDEQLSLEATNPSALYYVRTPLGDEQIESVETDDSEGTTEAGSILGQLDCLPTVEQGSSQFSADPDSNLANTTGRTFNSDFLGSDAAITTLPSGSSQKRSKTASPASLRRETDPKRKRFHTTPDLISQLESLSPRRERSQGAPEPALNGPYENDDQPSVLLRESVDHTPAAQTNITISKTIDANGHDIDLSQSSTASMSTSRLSKKRPRKSPESSTREDDDPPSKRWRTRCKSSDLMPASFQSPNMRLR
jgi:hypothetical protein